MRDVFARYNYHEIRTPIFEDTQLFSRSVGEETDIVSKEMFTWEDGERFNQAKLIDEWIRLNPSVIQQGQGIPSLVAKLERLGVRQYWRKVETPAGLTGHNRTEGSGESRKGRIFATV